MAFSTLQELKDRLTAVALSRGLASDSPVTMAFDNQDTAYEPVRVIASYVEPYDTLTPLNILWLVSDPASVDYDKLMRRVSRSGSGSYMHAWSEVTLLDDVWVAQVWDLQEPDDQPLYDHANTVGNPHNLRPEDIDALGTGGGALTGPLTSRTLAVDEEYAPEEFVPRSWIETALDEVRSVTEHILQFFDNLNAQIDNLRTRVEALEAWIFRSKGYTYTAETAAVTWDIVHNLNNSSVHVQVYEGDVMVWPADIQIVDVNTVRVLFAVPVAGTAEVIPVVTY